jgi:glutamine synthetase
MVQRQQFTFADLENWFNEQRVTEIECLVPDFTGVVGCKGFALGEFPEDPAACDCLKWSWQWA